MYSKFPIPALACALFLGSLATAQAAPFTVDGDLADWGAVVADSNGSNFSTLVSGATAVALPFVEDTNDSWGDGGFVGPNYGGQNYDVEFMAAALDGNTLYLAISSGLRPDNGFQRYGPGDIYIQSNAGVFGIEMGGGAGGGAGTAIAEGDDGATYAMNGNGFTTGHTALTGAQRAGTVWTDVSWLDDPIAPGTPVQFEADGGSTQVGTADYVFTRNTFTNQHSVMELALDVTDLLGGADGGTLEFHWGPTCGNDVATITVIIPEEDVVVSEPGTLAVVGAGIFGLAFWRRRRIG